MNTRPEEASRSEAEGSGNASAMPRDPLSEARDALRDLDLSDTYTLDHSNEWDLIACRRPKRVWVALIEALAHLEALPEPIRIDPTEVIAWPAGYLYPDAELVVA